MSAWWTSTDTGIVVSSALPKVVFGTDDSAGNRRGWESLVNHNHGRLLP